MTRLTSYLAILALVSLCLAAPAGAAPAGKPAAEKPAAAAKAPAEKPAAEKPAAKAPTAVKTPAPGPAPSPKGFCFNDTKGEYLDIYLDGRAVARYMYANNVSAPDRSNQTFKPYLHVFDAEGKATITKGPGGSFTHHRGIFFGWQKIGLEGKNYNLWEMAGGNRQVHQKFVAQTAGPDEASFTSLVFWNLTDGKTLIEEERTMTFYRRPAPTLAIIDFSTKVKSVAGDLVLAGDPEHGGVQYRAAEEVDRPATKYCLPKDAVDAPLDPSADWITMAVEKDGKKAAVTKIAKADLPWAGLAYTVGGKPYFVEEMSDPGNPKGTLWSAYRDYARFGAYPKAELKKDATLVLKYRFWVTGGMPPTREAFQKQYDEYVKTAPAAGK